MIKHLILGLMVMGCAKTQYVQFSAETNAPIHSYEYEENERQALIERQDHYRDSVKEAREILCPDHKECRETEIARVAGRCQYWFGARENHFKTCVEQVLRDASQEYMRTHRELSNPEDEE